MNRCILLLFLAQSRLPSDVCSYIYAEEIKIIYFSHLPVVLLIHLGDSDVSIGDVDCKDVCLFSNTMELDGPWLVVLKLTKKYI